jgi:hypothetical protein
MNHGDTESTEKKSPLVETEDVLGLVGIAMLAAGLGMISIPVMLITVGGLLVVIALIGAWRKHG